MAIPNQVLTASQDKRICILPARGHFLWTIQDTSFQETFRFMYLYEDCWSFLQPSHWKVSTLSCSLTKVQRDIIETGTESSLQNWSADDDIGDLLAQSTSLPIKTPTQIPNFQQAVPNHQPPSFNPSTGDGGGRWCNGIRTINHYLKQCQLHGKQMVPYSLVMPKLSIILSLQQSMNRH